ncbi:hypothetical protein [Bacillus sp. RO1]|nr:hypothetical protein [Bacillus sp. RO1]
MLILHRRDDEDLGDEEKEERSPHRRDEDLGGEEKGGEKSSSP